MIAAYAPAMKAMLDATAAPVGTNGRNQGKIESGRRRTVATMNPPLARPGRPTADESATKDREHGEARPPLGSRRRKGSDRAGVGRDPNTSGSKAGPTTAATTSRDRRGEQQRAQRLEASRSPRVASSLPPITGTMADPIAKEGVEERFRCTDGDGVDAQGGLRCEEPHEDLIDAKVHEPRRVDGPRTDGQNGAKLPEEACIGTGPRRRTGRLSR